MVSSSKGCRACPRPKRDDRSCSWATTSCLAPDLSILVDEFLRDRDLLIQGLAHPVATNAPSLIDGNQQQGPRPSPNGGGTTGFNGNGDESFFQKFGAVEVCVKSTSASGAPTILHEVISSDDADILARSSGE